MGRPPTHGAPSFRFFHDEVAEMEALLRAHSGHVPPRELLMSLANKFSNSQERSGKIAVQMKQVWNWFQNRRYALRSKLVKPPGNPNMPPNPRDEASQIRNVQPVPQQPPVPSGHNLVRNMPENLPMEFEAKSARDGAWYDVQLFLSHRNFDTGNPEVLVRFSGFGPEEDEWVIVLQNVRQRSLPCESSECVAVIPGDLILCFQEGKEQALYFDAHVLDAQRRRHDVRGCRCRFLVRYDHDQTEEIVPLRKVCRRPETDHRLQQLHAAIEAAAATAAAAASTSASASASESASTSVTAESKKPVAGPNPTSNLRMTNPNPSAAVTVPPPTITNVTAQTLMSASSSTPISASTPPSNLTSAPTLISAPSPSSVTVSAPIPTPISSATPSSILTSAPTPSPSSISAPTPSSTLVSAPSPSSAPISAPTLFSVPSPSPSSIPTFTPSSSSAPVSALLSPTPASAPLPTSISDPSPSSALISAAPASPALISAPSPTPAPTLTSISASTLAPAFAPSFSPVVAPVPTPTPTPTPGPVPISSSIPAAAPESKRLGSDDSGTSADGASAQEKIFNSGVADIVGEAKKEEIHSDLETSMVIDENSVSQKEINDKPTAPVPEPEKAGISAPSEPTMAVSASTTDDGLTISTEEMRNLTVSETRE